MKRLLLVIFILAPLNLSAGGEKIIETARLHYRNGDYYSSITESMRYQHLYPEGDLYAESMIIMGKSYYKGGNREKALGIFTESYRKFPDERGGEEGLFCSGIARLLSGSYYFAARTFQEYNFVYGSGIFYEDSVFSLCAARALAENYDEAERLLAEYKTIFPEGKYRGDAERLAELVSAEKNRGRKSPLLAGAASALLPGSGYFYTGNYRLGAISMLTNGLLLFLAYDGYRKENSFQMLFFSVVEFSFYNYSIVGSVKSARDYNDGSAFRRELLLGFKAGF